MSSGAEAGITVGTLSWPLERVHMDVILSFPNSDGKVCAHSPKVAPSPSPLSPALGPRTDGPGDRQTLCRDSLGPTQEGHCTQPQVLECNWGSGLSGRQEEAGLSLGPGEPGAEACGPKVLLRWEGQWGRKLRRAREAGDGVGQALRACGGSPTCRFPRTGSPLSSSARLPPQGLGCHKCRGWAEASRAQFCEGVG